MKLILVGLGNHGRCWYETLKREYRVLTVAVVDPVPAARERVEPADPFYRDFAEALEREQPDFIINATPPAVHNAINLLAFDHRVPVLCEKPIADNYAAATRIVERAARENIPLMIAENYRRSPPMRKLKALIEAGAIGAVAAAHVDFRRGFHTDKGYFLEMEHPLLEDVAVHHCDLMRYLTGAEGKRIFAKSYTPTGSWFAHNAALSLWLEMEGGVVVTYHGSLVARSLETDWMGHWIIEGTEGSLLFEHDRIRLVKNGQAAEITGWRELPAQGCLDEFLLSLQEQRPAETSGADYLNTQALVHFALESNRLGREVEVQLHR